MSRFLSLIAVLILASSTSASAQCTVSGLAGKWNAALAGWDTICTLTIGSTGQGKLVCPYGTYNGSVKVVSANGCAYKASSGSTTFLNFRTDPGMETLVGRTSTNYIMVGYKTF